VILDRKLDRVAKTGSARVNEPTGADSTARPMSSQEPLVQGPFRTQAVIPAQSCVAPNLAALDSAASRRAGAVELLADVGFVEGIYMHRSYRYFLGDTLSAYRTSGVRTRTQLARTVPAERHSAM